VLIGAGATGRTQREVQDLVVPRAGRERHPGGCRMEPRRDLPDAPRPFVL